MVISHSYVSLPEGIYLSIYPSIHPSIHLSVYPTIRLSIIHIKHYITYILYVYIYIHIYCNICPVSYVLSVYCIYVLKYVYIYISSNIISIETILCTLTFTHVRHRCLRGHPPKVEMQRRSEMGPCCPRPRSVVVRVPRY
jgi:hypothetical protein